VLILSSLGLLSPGTALSGPAKSEKAKVDQELGPLHFEEATLAEVLTEVLSRIKTPVEIEVCPAHLEMPVRLTTRFPERLGVILKALSFQTGSLFRLYIGHHSEVARPTFFCPDQSDGLITLRSKQLR
jgi:hypothetical protein